MHIFNQRLKFIMKQRGITQKQLANALDMDRSTISNWWRGTCLPTVNRLVDLADYLDVTTDYLLGRDIK